LSATLPERRNILIVGGGAGGAELAAGLGRHFGRSTMNVTLVDCATHHLWKPRLHEVAAGLLGAGEDETSYLALARANHFRFRLGALTGIDPKTKTVSLSAVKDSQGADLLGVRELRYDTLVLAFGSQVNDFGIAGVTEHCHLLDSGEQALAFQRHLLETAVRVSDGTLDRLRVGIVGAGATGVELAAELHHAVGAMQRFGGIISLEQLQVTVIDMAPRVLANSDPATSAFALRALERLGTTVRLDASVERVTAAGFFLKGGEEVPCELKVWASGIIGRPLAKALSSLQVERSRRIVCDEHLQCVGFSDVYALGDCAFVLDPKTQRPLPATAQVAHQQARYLVRVLSRGLDIKAAAPFKYRSMGSLVSLGTAPAAGEIPLSARTHFIFSGALPKLLYVSLQLMHRAQLIGWAQAAVLALADRLRRSFAPPVKLH
jgi:NADH dehydrogenase